MLADCLTALARQDYAGRYEIIVVNNASTDRTPEIARDWRARVVDEPAKGYVRALRAGFAAARGAIIACTDADTQVPSDWLSRLAERLTSSDRIVACTGTFGFHDGEPWLRLLARALGRCNFALAGGNMAVWRWAYEAVGGFDPAVNMGADRHLGQRLRRLGGIAVDKGLVVLTSARRYQAAFWPTVRMYVLNDLSMVVSGRPRFFDFPDIRRPVRRYIPRVRVRRARAAAVFATALLLLALTLAEAPGTQTLGPVLARTREVKSLVALTFDDGPSSHTGEVLDVLSRYGVRATFFVIGTNVERRPELARRIVAEGHAIGNHTYDHPFWAAVEDASRVRKELERGEQAIETATGVHATMFRPPHGWRSPWMIRAARREGYLVVTWSVSPDDWRRPSPEVIADRVLQATTPGSIVLLHDGLDLRLAPPVENTVQALPEIIEGLHARGFRFVTVPELVAVSNAAGLVSEPMTRAAR